MEKTCTNCGSSYDHTADDQQFIDEITPKFAGKKYPFLPPKLCQECRQQRRVAQANQLNLYERKCHLSGSTIISNFHPDSPHIVYRSEDWYSDVWDPLRYGRKFDFTRTFFEQFGELSVAVPRPQLHKAFEFDENADYTNYAGRNKNCYLIFDSEDNRDCYYCYSINDTESCIECFRIRKGELLAYCIDCVDCYHSAYLQDCAHCSDSVFLKNCIGCKHCLMCSNLQNKEYYVENKPVSREQFERFRSMLSSQTRLQSARERFEALKLEYPQKNIHGVQNEDVLGDYLTNCKHAENCFDSPDLWDCKHVFQAFGGLKNSRDIQECGEGERLYECAFMGYNSQFCMSIVHCLGGQSDMYYCTHSPHSNHLFGCIGCRKKQYCIFNTQYAPEEYEELAGRIAGHMRETGEWGEFLPIELSPFAYNETLAQEYYPMAKEQVLAKGWRWQENGEKQNQYLGPVVQVPDDIGDADDAICDSILRCETTGSLYKIIPQELHLYRKMSLPLPRKSVLERHRERFAMRNARKLWERKCGKCGMAMSTTYAPDRPEKIYCEECYMKEVY